MTTSITPNTSRLWMMISTRFNGGKQKSKKAVQKRMRVKGNGRIKRWQAGRQHNTGYKTRERSNRLGKSTGIEEPKMEKNLKRFI